MFHWVAASIRSYLVAQCGSVSALGRGQRLLDWTLLHGTVYAANADSLCNACRWEPAPEAQQMDLEADLIRALQNDEFELEYQPILDIEGGRIVGFEALLRWQHPARGQISPAQFIPFAEESGLIVPIGAWALEQACAAASRWPEELRVAVNVSARQIERSLLQTIAGSLSRSSLSPQRLEVEITESRSLCTNTNFALIDDLGPVDKVWQPYLCGCQGEECREGFSCLVVSGRDAPELLETVEHPLDAVSIFVNPKVAGRRAQRQSR